jgi:4-amino-4-deoxy-L-arabinose transferase-like glycosyltransferase
MNLLAKVHYRWIITLLAIGILVSLGAAIWIRTPGYMDSEYYFTTALSIVNGEGFTESYLWNYLDDPTGIPHPSHLYWMPLTTILSAGSMMVFGISYRAAQLPFLFLTAVLPILTAFVAIYLHKNQGWAWRAGVLAIFSGFYLPFLYTTDTFILYAWVGCAALWAMVEASRRPSVFRWLIVGVLVGLSHLIRTDGVLLLLPAVMAISWSDRKKAIAFLGLVIGYLLLMGPWWIRNIVIVGQPFPPGNARALWLLSYDELYSFPGSMLTPARWWASDFSSIVGVRLQALWTNLQRLLLENGIVFLSPFMVLGAFRFRKHPLTRITLTYLAILLFVMSFVFPFAGSRGGFFHSGAAAMPLLWAFAPAGLEVAIDWGAKIRGWERRKSQKVLGASVMVIVAILTVILFWSKVIGPEWNNPRWESGFRTYHEVGDLLRELSTSPDVVAVNNPPGFYLATHLECVAVPNGTVETLRGVVERYRVKWVVLDANRPTGLAPLYDEPSSVSWLEQKGTLYDASGREIYLLQVSLKSGPS